MFVVGFFNEEIFNKETIDLVNEKELVLWFRGVCVCVCVCVWRGGGERGHRVRGWGGRGRITFF